ncbi:MAG TPA: porin [Verrucomicrobiae bacterium]|jgi:phosphate-selective porin OprO/OprP|nr:porin [Verrucomicrobiae bacterium]
MRSILKNQPSLRRIASVALFLAISTTTPTASLRAAEAQPTTEELLQRINSLEQQLKQLQSQVQQQQSAPPAQSPTQPPVGQSASVPPAKSPVVFTAGPEGFGFQSRDSNFVMQLHGLVQMDSRTFFTDDKAKGNDSFLLRRARPIISGTVYHDFDYLITPEFGGNTVQVVDALINYHLDPQFQLQLGKMKPPVGLEAQQQEQYTFFNERTLATDLLPYRDIGVELHGDLFDGVVSYAAGVFNGVPDNVTTTTNYDFDNNKSFDGRLFVQPFRKTSITPLQKLGLGVAGTYQVDSGSTNNGNTTGLTQGFITPGQEKFFTYSNSVASTGVHTRITPQGYYYWGPFGLMGEYVSTEDHVSNFAKKITAANLNNTAWEISGGYVLTGEDDSYNGVTPKHPFSPFNGRWGALQLVGRYSELDVDKNSFKGFADPKASASQAAAWGVGLNWYLNRNVRINTSFERTTFEGGNGPKATVTKQPEEVFFTRVQLSF